MLLMNKTGRIYDVPDQVAEKYIATSTSREAVEDLVGTLRSRSTDSSEMEAAGCCNLYANYCPQQ